MEIIPVCVLSRGIQKNKNEWKFGYRGSINGSDEAELRQIAWLGVTIHPDTNPAVLCKTGVTSVCPWFFPVF